MNLKKITSLSFPKILLIAIILVSIIFFLISIFIFHPSRHGNSNTSSRNSLVTSDKFFQSSSQNNFDKWINHLFRNNNNNNGNKQDSGNESLNAASFLNRLVSYDSQTNSISYQLFHGENGNMNTNQFTKSLLGRKNDATKCLSKNLHAKTSMIIPIRSFFPSSVFRFLTSLEANIRSISKQSSDFSSSSTSSSFANNSCHPIHEIIFTCKDIHLEEKIRHVLTSFPEISKLAKFIVSFGEIGSKTKPASPTPYGKLLYSGISHADASSNQILILSPFVELERGFLCNLNVNATSENRPIAIQCLLVKDDDDEEGTTTQNNREILDAGWTVEVSTAAEPSSGNPNDASGVARNEEAKFFEESLYFANREYGSPRKSSRIFGVPLHPVDAISIHHCVLFTNRKILAQIFGDILFQQQNAIQDSSYSFHVQTPTETDLLLSPLNSQKLQIVEKIINNLFASIIQVEMILNSLSMDQVLSATPSLRRQVRRASVSVLPHASQIYQSLASTGQELLNKKSKLIKKREGFRLMLEENSLQNLQQGDPDLEDVLQTNSIRESEMLLKMYKTEKEIIFLVRNESGGDATCMRNDKFRFAPRKMQKRAVNSQPLITSIDRVLECACDQLERHKDFALKKLLLKSRQNNEVHESSLKTEKISDHLLGWEISMRLKMWDILAKKEGKTKTAEEGDGESLLLAVSSLAVAKFITPRNFSINNDRDQNSNDLMNLQRQYFQVRERLTISSAMLSSVRGFESYLDFVRAVLVEAYHRSNIYSVSLSASSSSSSSGSPAFSSKSLSISFNLDSKPSKAPPILMHVVWYFICCGCCGFSAEITHFVRPLSRKYILSLIPGPTCFCPGLPEGFSDILHRQHLMGANYGNPTSSLIQNFHGASFNHHQQQDVNQKNEKLIWISHTDPTSFAQQGYFVRRKPDYFIGRTMYEFSRIPDRWDVHLQQNNKNNNDNNKKMKENLVKNINNSTASSRHLSAQEIANDFFAKSRQRKQRDEEYPSALTIVEQNTDELWVPSQFVRNVFLEAIDLHNKEADYTKKEAEEKKRQKQERLAQSNNNTKKIRRTGRYFVAAPLRQENTNIGNAEKMRGILLSTELEKLEQEAARKQMRYGYSTEKIHIDPERVVIIPEGVDSKFYNPEAILREESFRLTNDSLFDTRTGRKKWKTSFCNRDSYFVDEHVGSRFSEANFARTSHFPWGRRQRSNESKSSRKQMKSSSSSPDQVQSFQFFSNFKWEPRKGWDFLLEVYFNAFANSQETEDTTLVILSYYFYPGGTPTGWSVFNSTKIMEEVFERFPPSLLEKKYKKFSHLSEMPRFCVVAESVTEFELAQLFRGADAFVLPTRGEGWGLPTMQAMAMGLPVISTNWGGSVDFTTKETSFLIDIDGVEEVPKDSLYGWREGKKWAIPSVDHLEKLMRYVYENQEAAKEVGKKAREHIVKNFDEDVVARVVDSRLKKIREEFL